MPRLFPQRAAIPALILVVLAAALLRAPGLFWGYGLLNQRVAFALLHPDEARFIEIARGLDEGRPFRRSYVLGFGYLLRGMLAAARMIGRELSDAELVMGARLISFATGLLLVGLTFALARDLKLPTDAALVAAGLVASNTLCVTQAHVGTADTFYATLVYAFLCVALAWQKRPRLPRLFTAGILAGAAAAMKFGPILAPAVLLLPFQNPHRRTLGLAGVVAAAGFAFWALQGFSFTAAGWAAILKSARLENFGGLAHPRWANPLIYAVQIVRTMSFPAVVALGAGIPRALSGFPAGARRWILASPLLLHALGLQALVLPFPRHLLVLMPFLAITAASGFNRLGSWKWPLTFLALLASASLAWTDGRAYRRDARAAALAWAVAHLPADVRVAADPFFARVPAQEFFAVAQPYDADAILRHEGWFYRFRRSELFPFRPPAPDTLYHATQSDAEIERWLDRGLEGGTWLRVFEASPPILLPEQWLYHALWGSFDKFAGRAEVLVRASKRFSP